MRARGFSGVDKVVSVFTFRAFHVFGALLTMFTAGFDTFAVLDLVFPRRITRSFTTVVFTAFTATVRTIVIVILPRHRFVD
jgi:hypothetical protein